MSTFRTLFVSALFASAALAASVVGPVSVAHAADPYTPRANVQCTISVPPAVAGQHIRIKVGARTNADKPPTGTVTVQVRRGSHGPVLWNKTIDYKDWRVGVVTQRSGPSWVTIATSTSPSAFDAPAWMKLSMETPASRIAAVISASTPVRSTTVKRM